MPLGIQRGKLRDFNTLIQNTELQPHIPETRSLTLEWLHKMVYQYPLLYIKPDNSSQGVGIIRTDRMGDHSIMLRSIDTKHYSFHQNPNSLFTAINRLKRKKHYIIQQGITSTTQLHYPFDIRIHVLKANDAWTIGGMIGKVAKKKSIVTNASKGALPTHIDTILNVFRGYSEEQSQEIKSTIEKITIDVATEMGKKHTDWKEFGLDVGIDEENRIWIYEVNFKPGCLLFRNIDQPAYLHIRELQKQIS